MGLSAEGPSRMKGCVVKKALLLSLVLPGLVFLSLPAEAG